jgi:hypothetical protein
MLGIQGGSKSICEHKEFCEGGKEKKKSSLPLGV